MRVSSFCFCFCFVYFVFSQPRCRDVHRRLTLCAAAFGSDVKVKNAVGTLFFSLSKLFFRHWIFCARNTGIVCVQVVQGVDLSRVSRFPFLLAFLEAIMSMHFFTTLSCACGGLSLECDGGCGSRVGMISAIGEVV